MMMTTTLASRGNQTTKVKRPKEGGFCVTFSFWVLFFDGSFFFLYVSIKFRNFFFLNHQKFGYCLQIKHNRRFLPQSEQLCHGLGFF
jgi:hypothetical protein